MTARQEDGYNKTLPTRIRAILDKKKMKRNELAEKSGISRQRIGYYADGTNVPDAETLAKIAVALEVSTDYLLGISDDEHKKNARIVTYSDAAYALEEMVAAARGWSIKAGMETKHIGEDKEEQVFYIRLNMGDDSVLYSYFNAVNKMNEAVFTLPSETAKELLEPFKKNLKETTLNSIIIESFHNLDDEFLPF